MINRNNQKILTDDQIVDVIINYIDEDLYNYAVMIDGEWGCGKTHFIQNYLYNKLEAHENENKKRKIIYLSLYGVKSFEEVTKQLLMESILLKAGTAKSFIKKGSEVVVSTLPMLFDLLKNKGIELNFENISEVTEKVEKFVPIKNNILIFDDLERCDCPINEILGYINTFVEHEGMKVIIVANQKEIGKSVYSENQELKYLVAAHENIMFEEKTRQKAILEYYGEKEKSEDDAGPININTIKSRIDRLFGKNEMYEKVKEKLVGVTIYYYPALQSVFNVLIKNDKINGKLQELLIEKCFFFEDYMIKEEHLNLRTFQFFLSKISVLYEAICKLDDENQEAFFNYIIEYCFKICVCYKKGILKYEWSKNEECGFRKLGLSDLYGNNLAFRFVDDFVIKSILVAEDVKRMLELYVDEYIKKRNDKVEILRELETGWYLSDDNTIEEHIEKLMQALDANEFEMKEYSRIIGLFVELEHAGFSSRMTETVVLKMKKNIDNLKKHVSLDAGYGILKEGEKRKRYEEILTDIQREIDKHFQTYVSNTLGAYLEIEDSWAENLYDYIIKNRSEISNVNGFLTQFDIQQLAKKVMNSKSYDIHAFRGCILTLYVQNSIGEALKKDKEILINLENQIREIDQTSFDKVKKMQIKYLILNIQNAVDQYDENEE